jgi:hypothetical protein
MDTGATMRRILVAGSSLVVLALVGFLAVGVGARTVAHVGHASAKPRPLGPVLSGTPCYLSIPRCSQVPCVEFIGSGSASALLVPRLAVTDRCRSHRSAPPAQIISKAAAQAQIAAPAALPALQLVLSARERRLPKRKP